MKIILKYMIDNVLARTQ